jgi:hypothetical protein
VEGAPEVAASVDQFEKRGIHGDLSALKVTVADLSDHTASLWSFVKARMSSSDS